MCKSQSKPQNPLNGAFDTKFPNGAPPPPAASAARAQDRNRTASLSPPAPAPAAAAAAAVAVPPPPAAGGRDTMARRGPATIADLHLLWDDDRRGGGGGGARCGTKVLDTVLFRDARPSRWLFTNKHSRVAKKKPANLTLDRIRDRFLRLANVGKGGRHQNNNNNNNNNHHHHEGGDGGLDDFVPVALVYTSDGSSTSLTKRAFEELLDSSHDGRSLPGVTALQAMVQVGTSGREAVDAPVYRVTFRRDTGHVGTKRLTSGRSFRDVVAHPSAARAEQGVQGDLRQVVDFVEATGHLRVRELSADFVMDDKHYLWLSRLHRLDAQPEREAAAEQQQQQQQRGDGKENGGSRQSTPESRGSKKSMLPKVRGALPKAGHNDGAGGQAAAAVAAASSTQRPSSEQSSRDSQMGSARRSSDGREERDVRSASSKHRDRIGKSSSTSSFMMKGKRKPKNNFLLDAKEDAAGAAASASTSTSTLPKSSSMPSVGPRPTLDGDGQLVTDRNKPAEPDPSSSSSSSFIPAILKKRGGTPPSADTNDGSGSRSHSSSSSKHNSAEVITLRSRVSELDETISKMQARLSAEATVNARLTERLRTLRETMTQAKTDGANTTQQQLAQMKQAIRAARAECVESREREASLQKQVGTLEAQADTLKKRLGAESDVADRETKRARALEKKLADQQREWTKALREKDAAMRREILATEERLHRTLAAGGDAGADGSGGGGGGGAGGGGRAGPKSPEANALVRTVEELNRKFVTAQNEWTAKAAEDQTRHRLEMLEQEERMNQSLARPREQVRELEDQVQNLQAEMCVMVKDVSVAKKKEQELQRRIASLQGDLKQAEDGKRLLEQSVKALESMGDGAGSAADQDRKESEMEKASADGKIRMLNNEVDFLRAQLTSESQCRADLETSLRDITARFQDAKDKWTAKLREAEDAKRREARDLEERFRQEMLAPRAEISRLEDKLQSTQRQLADIMKDLQLSQDQYSATEATKRALETELRATKETMDQRTEELAEVRFQLKGMAQEARGDSAYKATSEATMRKLQNEVRYLQSQLTSETQCKDDLETALRRARNETEEQAHAHQEELQAVGQKARAEAEATLERESHLRDHKISLEGEVLNLSKQLTDLKRSYAKLRDQQRVDMQQLDATKKSAARLEVALQAARSELKRERQANESQQKRHERAMAAVHQTVTDLSAAKKAAIESMEKQVSLHMEKVGATQRDMLKLRDQFDLAQLENQRRLGAERISACLHAWQRTRRHAAFATWKGFLTLDRHREALEARHAQEVQDLRDDHMEDKENTCKMLLEEYRRNKDEAMAEFARHHAGQVREREREKTVRTRHRPRTHIALTHPHARTHTHTHTPPPPVVRHGGHGAGGCHVSRTASARRHGGCTTGGRTREAKRTARGATVARRTAGGVPCAGGLGVCSADAGYRGAARAHHHVRAGGRSQNPRGGARARRSEGG